VTDDEKEDWWLRIGGRTIGPLPAIRNEIHREAGVLFHMYSGNIFLERARKTFNLPVRDETAKEVKQVREEQQRRKMSLDEVRETYEKIVREQAGAAARLNGRPYMIYPHAGWEDDPVVRLAREGRGPLYEVLSHVNSYRRAAGEPELAHDIRKLLEGSRVGEAIVQAWRHSLHSQSSDDGRGDLSGTGDSHPDDPDAADSE
jgi:hypothetical protein